MHCVFKAPNVHFNRLTTCDQCFFFKSQVAKELTLYVELTMLVLKKKKRKRLSCFMDFFGAWGFRFICTAFSEYHFWSLKKLKIWKTGKRFKIKVFPLRTEKKIKKNKKKSEKNYSEKEGKICHKTKKNGTKKLLQKLTPQNTSKVLRKKIPKWIQYDSLKKYWTTS